MPVSTVSSSNLSSEKQHLQAHQTLDSRIFFQVVLESLVDGVLILTHQGKLLHTNDQAKELLQTLTPNPSHPQGIPQEIWRICQSLIEGYELFADQNFVIESDVSTPHSSLLRLRGRWFKLDDHYPPYLLIILEDCDRSLSNQVNADIKRFGFTAREAEVWSLRRSQCSYKEIATKLYISLNTVKKHMRNINAKRQRQSWLRN